MDARIEQYFRDQNMEGELDSSRREKYFIHTKQLIIYILSRAINSRSIAQMMGCSLDTVYKSIKIIKKKVDAENDPNKSRPISLLITRVTAALTYNYDLPWLDNKDIIPLLLRK